MPRTSFSSVGAPTDTGASTHRGSATSHPQPEVVGGLAAQAKGQPEGTVLFDAKRTTIRNGVRMMVSDRIVRVEGRRYPAVRRIEEKPEASAPLPAAAEVREMVADQILVNLAPGTTIEDLSSATGIAFTLRRVIPGTGTTVLAFAVEDPEAIDRVQAAVAARPDLVRYAEPDYIVRVSATPNDPRYADGSLWGMHNTGQSAGTSDADVDAPEGWDVRTSAISAALTQSRENRTAFGFGPNELVVAVVDTGIRYTHEDLVANMWTNPGEIPNNGIDDDANGVTDDIYGVNAVADNGDPMDDHYHGTHCAGTIAAAGNNTKGVAGIAWQARLVACKFLANDGSGANSDASEAIWYAWEQAGADIISNSWGGSVESQEVTNQLRAAAANGAIIVVAAGNDAVDLESRPTYPAASQVPNMITVSSSTRTDSVSSFSNTSFGWSDIFAPGSDIVSCGNEGDAEYRTLSGTSMATPMVAGVAALLRAHFPGETAAQIINRIHRSADKKTAFSGKCQTGGRVNLAAALATTSSTPANDAFAEATTIPAGLPRSLRMANFAATTEAGEPAHAGAPANKSVWFSWTAPATGNYVVSTRGSFRLTVTPGSGGTPDAYGTAGLDTVLGIYTGSSLATLAAVASNDDYSDSAGGVSAWSRATFAATSGTTYRIAVGTESSTADEGLLILSISEPPANDLFAAASTVGAVPYSAERSNLNAALETGEPSLTRADVTDTNWLPTDAPAHIRTKLAASYPDKRGQMEPGGASIWWTWTPSITAEYTVSTEGSAVDTILGIHTGSAVNALSLVAQNDDVGLLRMGNEWVYLTSSRVRQVFQAGIPYRIKVDGFAGREGAITLNIARPPENDNIASATVVTGLRWNTTVNNTGASFEPGEPRHAGEYGGVSVWYRWTAPATQDFTIATPVSTMTTLLAVYTAANPAVPDVNELTPVASSAAPGFGSNVRIAAVAGRTYFIALDGSGGKQRDNTQLFCAPANGVMLNDDFAERIALAGTTTSVGSSTSGATYETGEPSFAGPLSVWWTWTAPATGNVTMTTQFSSYNAPIGVFTGSAVNALTEVARHVPASGQGVSEFGTVTFPAVRGTTYQIAIYGDPAYCGACVLNLSMTPANGLPSVTHASLSASEIYSDQTVNVSGVVTTDPEGNPVNIAHQWQSSADGHTWTPVAGQTSASLPAGTASPGLSYRCRLVPSDATGDGEPFFTTAVAVRARPVQASRQGQSYAADGAQPVTTPLAPARRKVILNEFCKGAGTPTQTGTLNGEWYELLVLQDQSMTGYFLSNVFRSIRFKDVPLWQNVPKGTLIVIYNPSNKSPLLPPDDLSTSDGNHRIVVSGSDANFFDNGNGFAPTCPKLSGSADTMSDSLNTGARLVLSRSFTGTLDDISYHDVSLLGGDSQFKRNPHLPAWLPGGHGYRYIGDTEDGCEASAAWELGNADANFATPGQPNNIAQGEWLTRLRAPAPAYRFGGASVLPAGLTIDPATGEIAGTPSSPGLYSLQVERYATGMPVASRVIQLLVGTADGVFEVPAGQTFTLTGDLDLGTATLVNKGTLNTGGFSLTQKQSYATWAAAHGIPGGRSGTFTAAGINNMMAFALNLDPSNAGTAHLPRIGTAEISGQRYLTLQFRRQKGTPRVGYAVQSTADVAPPSGWADLNTASYIVGSPVSLDHGTELVTVRDAVPIGGTNARRFLRLKVFDNLTPPAAPASPSAALGNASATITWTASVGADSYNVKRATTPGGPYTTVAAGLTGTSFHDTTVTTGTTYYYVITAVTSADGEGVASAEVSITTPASWLPAAPTGLAATADATRVLLTWNSVANATSYTIRRSPTGGSGHADIATGITGTSFSDTSGNHTQTYHYVVIAVNGQGGSPPSNEVSTATTPYSWTVDASGNWSSASNWGQTNHPDGLGRAVVFGPLITATRTVTLDTNATVGSLLLNEDTVTANAYVVAFNSGRSLTFDVPAGQAAVNARGVGGYQIGTQGTGTIQLNDTLAVSAGASGAATADAGTVALSSQLTGPGGLVLSSLNSNDGTGTVPSGSRGTYLRSTSANTFAGGVTVNSGYLGLAGNIGNLGTGTLTLNASDSTHGGIGTGLLLKTGGGTLSNNIVFGNPSATGGGSPRLQINIQDSGASSYNFTGALSGSIAGQQVRFMNLSGNSSLTLSGDGSGLATGANGAWEVRRGSVILNHPNALGPANTVGNGTNGGWVIGDFSNATGLTAQLLTAGHNVGGRITTQQTTTAGQSSTDHIVVGGSHTNGTVTFSGNIALGRIVAGSRQFRLTSAAGGTTAFTGLIADGAATGSAASAVPVVITGTGTVLLNNASNTYSALTTVQSSATLGGTGRTGGALTVADGGRLAFTISTVPGSHDRFDVQGALAFAGASTLAIAKSGAYSTGTYTLVTATGGISGTLPTLSLPAGWSATLQVNGNDLQLVVNAAP